MSQKIAPQDKVFDKTRFLHALLVAAAEYGACTQKFATLFDDVSMLTIDPDKKSLEFSCKNKRHIMFRQTADGEYCEFVAAVDGEETVGEFAALSCFGLTHKDIFSFCFEGVRVHTVVGEDKDDADAY